MQAFSPYGDIAAAKRALRQTAKRTLAETPVETRATHALAICSHLQAHPAFRGSVLFYAPFDTEVDLTPAAATLAAARGVVCVPRIDWAAASITPARVNDLGPSLRQGPRRVPEPPADAPSIPLEEIDLILVPGLAFDLRGGRLGRGGGFYDRLLASPSRRCPAIGVCFHAQLVDAVPMERHDQPVDGVITEQRCFDRISG
ncbi:MAG: 5-formyltetrahydrofolate cyclo-ligase [Phycisphaeraceae bacterium]|nr:5-formyltetrahydrofolate cyclo-ligase [Phycisphaeraceae bacterium]